MVLSDPELDALVHAGATKVLHRAWQPELGYCRPNRRSYPHLWLWDSCFHSIAWSALGDERGLRELEAVFEGQLRNGFLPHMRYGKRTYARGPLPKVSSFTQPPVFARALQAAAGAGLAASDRFDQLLDKAARALDALWRTRMRDGLLVLVHPWEAGTDDSPRWDSWVGSTSWRRRLWTKVDRELLESTEYSADGVAVDNRHFVVASASYNAIAADAAITFSDLVDDDGWRRRGQDLAAALDASAWDDEEQLWSDVVLVGPPDTASARIPTLDALLPALCTPDRGKADKALAQLGRPDRFAAPYGPRFVPPDPATYRPDQYWRGPTWPQLNYLVVLAANRCEVPALAADIAVTTKRSVLRSGFSEYWNPETGRGLGAKPQTWAAVAAGL